MLIDGSEVAGHMDPTETVVREWAKRVMAERMNEEAGVSV